MPLWLLKIVIQVLLAGASEGTKSGGNFLELLKVAVGALGPILAALIAGTMGVWITHRYTTQREEAERRAADARHNKDIEALQKRHDLDKESEWRTHAVELTKLEVGRKLEVWKATSEDKRSHLRPSVLDFLANYRDLIELDRSTPRDLYLKILSDRITQLSEDDLKTLSPAEVEEVVAKQAEQDSQPLGIGAAAGEGEALNSQSETADASPTTPEHEPEIEKREEGQGGRRESG